MAEPDDPSDAAARDQGCLVAGCFRCELLHPGGRECPRCGRTPRFVPAQMMSRELVAEHVERLAGEWARTPGRDTLVRLLDALHLHGPAARDALSARGLALDDLRRAYDAIEAGGGDDDLDLRARPRG